VSEVVITACVAVCAFLIALWVFWTVVQVILP